MQSKAPTPKAPTPKAATPKPAEPQSKESESEVRKETEISNFPQEEIVAEQPEKRKREGEAPASNS